jgi:hypothetical protein
VPSFDALIQGGALGIVAFVVWQMMRILNGRLERLARALELNTRATVRLLARVYGDQLTDDEELRKHAEGT